MPAEVFFLVNLIKPPFGAGVELHCGGGRYQATFNHCSNPMKALQTRKYQILRSCPFAHSAGIPLFLVLPSMLLFWLLPSPGLHARFFEIEHARVVETRSGGVEPHIEGT